MRTSRSTLYEMCAVHWRVSGALGGGGYHQRIGGHHDLCGGDYECIGRCLVDWGTDMTFLVEHPQCTDDIPQCSDPPQCTDDIPTQIMTSPWMHWWSRGALQLHLYGGVWPQDWKIDPSADKSWPINKQKQTHSQTIYNRNWPNYNTFYSI